MFVEVCKRKITNRNNFVAVIHGTDKEKRKKVFDMARTASFIVGISEKGQAILTCTVVSYKA